MNLAEQAKFNRWLITNLNIFDAVTTSEIPLEIFSVYNTGGDPFFQSPMFYRCINTIFHGAIDSFESQDGSPGEKVYIS